MPIHHSQLCGTIDNIQVSGVVNIEVILGPFRISGGDEAIRVTGPSESGPVSGNEVTKLLLTWSRKEWKGMEQVEDG